MLEVVLVDFKSKPSPFLVHSEKRFNRELGSQVDSTLEKVGRLGRRVNIALSPFLCEDGQTLKGFENGFERKQDLDGN